MRRLRVVAVVAVGVFGAYGDDGGDDSTDHTVGGDTAITDTSCTVGSSGCACYSNGACNPGLMCIGGSCGVDSPDTIADTSPPGDADVMADTASGDSASSSSTTSALDMTGMDTSPTDTTGVDTSGAEKSRGV